MSKFHPSENYRKIYTTILLALGLTITYAQTPATFTATNMKVMDTLTNLNVIKAEAITANDTIRAKDHVVAEQDIKVEGNITIDGNLNTSPTSTANLGEVNATGNLRTQAGIILATPGNSSNLTMKAWNPTGNSVNTGPIISVGIGNASPNIPPPCSLPNSAPWMAVNGGFIVNTNSGLINSSLSMYTAPWDGSGFLELEGTDNNGNQNNLLAINHFCGRDIWLGMGSGALGSAQGKAGCRISMGDFVSMRQSVQIGNTTGIFDANTSLSIHQGGAGKKGIVFKTADGNLPIISVANTNIANGASPLTAFADGRIQILVSQTNNKIFTVGDINATSNAERFVVYADGKTYIGIQKPLITGPHSNAMLAVDGKILAKEIYVNVHNTVWADYVFEKNYKLLPLQHIKKYIEKEKHLPGIPSGIELEENGLALAEMQAKQMEKIEELYLYNIQLQEELENLKLEMLELKKQNKKLPLFLKKK